MQCTKTYESSTNASNFAQHLIKKHSLQPPSKNVKPTTPTIAGTLALLRLSILTSLERLKASASNRSQKEKVVLAFAMNCIQFAAADDEYFRDAFWSLMQGLHRKTLRAEIRMY